MGKRSNKNAYSTIELSERKRVCKHPSLGAQMGIKMKIEICGSGCGKFFQTVDSFKKAVRFNRMIGTVEEITDGKKIAARGRLNLPAVFVNGRLVSQGEGLTPESAGELLRAAV